MFPRYAEDMDLRTLSDTLKRLAFAHELIGSERRASTYGRASWPLRQLDGDLRELIDSGQLIAVRGIGQTVLAVAEAVANGEVPEELEQLEAQIPPGVFRIGQLKGLGPKKVKALWQGLGVTTLGELEYACQENRLVDLKGFGTKTQDKVLASIGQARQWEGWFRRDTVGEALAVLRDELGELHPAGDYRRGFELVRALDVVVVGAEDHERSIDGLPVRVWGAQPDELGTVLVQRTGSDEHLAELGELPRAASEEVVYEALGFWWQPAERREAGVPLVRKGLARPRLVRREDLLGALHNHTTASDGRNTLEEMRHAAAELGLSYLGVTEHSQESQIAGGLDAERLIAQVRRIEALNAQGHPCTLVTGVESDILRDGELDYPPEILEQLELVVASVHRRHRQDGAAMTARMLAAVRNPWTDMVGHPTGRLLLGRPPTDLDVEVLLDACAEVGCSVELNASPHRLDLKAEHLAWAKERGIPVSIGADAHSVRALKNLDYGVAIARRAGLTPDDVMNAWELPRVKRWLAERRARHA